MSNCILCLEPIEEMDKVAEVPCCEGKYHSNCLIYRVGGRSYHGSPSFCECGQLLYEHIDHELLYEHIDHDYQDPHSRSIPSRSILDSILEKPGVKEELEILKQKLKQERTAYKEVSKLISSESKQFHEDTKQVYNIIQDKKKYVVNSIRDSDSYRAYQSANKSIASLYNKFNKTHDVSTINMDDLIPGFSKWYYSSITYRLKRSFRGRRKL